MLLLYDAWTSALLHFLELLATSTSSITPAHADGIFEAIKVAKELQEMV